MLRMSGLAAAWIGVLFLAGICHCADDLYFTKSPQNVEVVQGKPVTLACEVAPPEGVRYYWELNGSSLENTTRRYQRGSDLHITRVDRERDSGQFTCVAVDPNGISITSSSASLNIQWIDEPSVQLQEPETTSAIQAGGDVILRCHLDASGDVHYEWFRNGDRLTKSPRIEIKKKRLHLKSVKPIDNGIYRCGAKNEAGIKYSSKNFVLAVQGDHVPTIQTPPTNQAAKEDTSAFFDCVYQGADVTEWYFKDVGPLHSTEKYKIHPNQTLEIKSVKNSDEGLYNCVGIKSESTEVPQSYTAELKIAQLTLMNDTSFEPPLPSGGKFILAEGSSFQLTCLEPLSFPETKKWWLNSAGHTVSDAGEVKVDDDGRLIIAKVDLKHSGNYTCAAENVAGRTERSIELIVITPPVIEAHPQNLTVSENEEFKLVCRYETQSKAVTAVRWRKEGKLVKHEYDPSNHHQRVKVFRDNATLLVHNAQPQDRGDYVCEISTDRFEPVTSKPISVAIIETLKFVPPPVDRNLELGSVGKVHCKAQGTPPPTVHWVKNGTEPDSFPGHITDMNGTLHFNGVLMEDKGEYSCIASNSQGVINTSIVIEVVVSPKFNVTPKNPTEATEGQSVIIDCVVDGKPKPTIHWDKNLAMNDFDKSRFSVLENGSLFISEVRKEDENKYGCTAGSSAGLNRKETLLIVIPSDDSTVTKAVLITMSVAAAYIILVVGLMVWCRYRRKSRKIPVTEGKLENGDVEHTELKEDPDSGSSKKGLNGIENHKEGQKSDGAETTHSQSSGQSRKSKSSYDKVTVPKSHLKETKLIGRGEFGDVMLGKMSKSQIPNQDKRQSTTNSITEDKDVLVLIKAFSHTKDENCLTDFKKEIDIFSKLTHENVIQMIGLCRDSEPHYMLLEYTDWGDLKQFLLATQKGSSPPLSPVQAAGVLHQIAKAMDYVSSHRIVLKDLAARNCLVTSSLSVKVGLPRLTRDPYSQEYCKHVNHIIPLRWMPYEAVYEDEFSTKSDVYSFGVVVWEVFSQGELPFPKLNDNSVLTKLKEKKLEWKAHTSTPEDIEALQMNCLDLDPQKRPAFSEIASTMAEILTKM
ncbi:tyrosine-protein kinase-like otk [Harmonia axyridis]|uniref:tyrosine-protein kinase-like otk n=1 Tax=Harmonia axyridis TaxID=115357 RepID=UPI001E278EFD|nr:tyrosine-protein kinase-like otk [Harmonia axyridis]